MPDIFSGLNQEQKEAVRTINGPVLIIAGAGSGKTRALTHRLAYLIQKNIAPENILALTFTNKAAREMRKRVNQLVSFSVNQSVSSSNNQLQTDKLRNWQNDSSFVGTFHSLGAKILRQEIGVLNHGSNFVIYDENDTLSLIKEIMAELAIDMDQFRAGAVYQTISKQKNELIEASDYSQSAQEPFEKITAKVYFKYEDYLKAANALDFDDLLFYCVKIFREHPDILEKYQDRFQYILVDEYQDTNQAQYVLLNLLAQKHKNLCVVGDDWQSIYAFRGADFRNILRFEKDYPEAKIVFLEENYRSTRNILDAAHAVIEKNIYKTDKRLWTQKKSGEKVKIAEVYSETDEADYVIEEIKTILYSGSGIASDLNDFAVLYRTNSQSRAIEEAVLREGWAYKMVGALKFYDRREIKDIISYLRFIQNRNDIVSLKRIINTPPRGIGKATWDKIKSADDLARLKFPKLASFWETINELEKISGNKNVSGLIKSVLEKINYKNLCLDGTNEGESRWENIQELIGVAAKFDDWDGPLGLSSFLEEIALTSSADDVSDEKGELNLMTLHSAKGLEFPVVFIAGAEEGLLPHSRSIFNAGEMEEERRLCYVGLTRAREMAYLIFTRRRNLYGQTQPSIPSRFLGDIPAHLIDFTESGYRERLIDI